jgi:ribosomal protein S18 acetylase RimI-like enzyme
MMSEAGDARSLLVSGERAARALASRLLCDVFRGAKPDVRRAVARCDCGASFLLLERRDDGGGGGTSSGAAGPAVRTTALSLSEAARLAPAQLRGARALGALLAWPRPLDPAWRARSGAAAAADDDAAAEAAPPPRDAVYVAYVGVARWRRRRGLGQQLLQHALAAYGRGAAGACGCAWLESRTLDQSHSLYLRAGFSRVGVVAGLYGDGPWGEATGYHRVCREAGGCTCGAAPPAAAAPALPPPRPA